MHKLIAVALIAVTSGACTPKQKAPASPPRPEAVVEPEKGAKLPKGLRQGGPGVVLSPLHFDYDSALLRPEASAVLVRVADYLGKNQPLKIAVEGHCDERGTEEYNIALGDKRARAARDYLVRLGVDPGRIRTVSYGKLRPAALGGDEATHAKNRRAEFVPEPAPGE